MDHPNVPDGRAAWALILAAAVPTAAAIRLGWLVLGGSWDGAFGFDQSTTGMQLLGDRWSNLWWLNPATPTLLMAGVLPLLLLAIVVATGRPHVLVPTRAARFAATVVAAITALVVPGQDVGDSASA